MPLYDLDGTTVGSAIVDGSLSVFTSVGGTLAGGSSVSAPGTLTHYFSEHLVGAANVSVTNQTIFNVSGLAVGAGSFSYANVLDFAGISVGSAVVSGDAQRFISFSGYAQGSSSFNLSAPDPIYGVAVVSAYMELVHVPPPICQQPVVSLAFRWGHVFTVGDLTFRVLDNRGNPFNPVCVSYTLYQMQHGYVLKQIGPSGRRPGTTGVGSYYVTGTAGECGQPGLWAVRWKYQRTFSNSAVETDCYFQVADAVSCPIPGDTLQRVCKYGWD